MIAIHNSKSGFHPRWVGYCKKNNIPYKIVNAYDTNIIEQLADCDAFMWHHVQYSYKDMLFAKQLLFSLQQAGIKVFPDFNTGWHFDDKVGQKYLLEAINAPFVKSYAFYTKKDALKWVEKTSFPKVFKLRGGAGSANVKLAKSRKGAIRLINKAFGKGFKQYDAMGNLKERLRKYKEGKTNLKDVVKGFIRLVYSTEFSKMYASEKGYVYFQDFMSNNEFDIRIVVIGNKALGEKRFARKNDFRASGSEIFSFEGIDKKIISIAFSISRKLNLQSVAFDFVYDKSKNPLIIEMSYCFGVKGISQSPGYWTDDLVWHRANKIDFYGWMIENLINETNKNTNN